MWSEPATIVAPADIPVSVAEAKQFSRIEHADDDAMIATLIQAATARAEATTGTRFVAQTVRLQADDWAELFSLPIGPVTAVSEVRYEDLDAQEQVFADVELFGQGLSRGIRLTAGSGWPNDVRPVSGAITVELNVGYTDLPQSLAAAIMLMVGDLYANRETAAVGMSASEIPMSMQVETLLNQHRIWL